MAYIEARHKKLRLYVNFYVNGHLKRLATDYYCLKRGEKKCKCKGCKAAEGLALEVQRKLDSNTYNPADYFEKEKNAINVTSDVLLSEYLLQWLEIKRSVVEYSSYISYKSSLNSKVLPYIKGLKLVDIRPSHIRYIVAELVKKGFKPKTIRNAMIPLYNAFEYAITDRLITENPAARVQLPKNVVGEPDPFSPKEIFRIVEYMEENYPEIAAFFAIGFFTGMRTGEILALEWKKVEFDKNRILINATNTANRRKESTKTNKPRYVDIVKLLDKYLIRQREYTFFRSTHLFVTSYGEPYMSSLHITRKYWKPALKALNMRYRKIYNMRHSFACMMLEAGESMKWVANMLGHVDLSMVTKVYGNWCAPVEGRAGKRFAERIANL